MQIVQFFRDLLKGDFQLDCKEEMFKLIFRRLVRANRVQSRVVSREYYDWPLSEMAKKSILVRFGSLALPFSSFSR